jgi:hypothetical protein
MSEKAGDKPLVDFSKHVKETLASTMSNAHAAGIPEADVDAVIEQMYTDHAKVASSRVISRIRKQVGSMIELKSATAIKGCLVGSRDRFGKPSPIRYILLKPDKKHIEISNFGTKTLYKGQEDYPIPIPSLVTIRVTPELEYNTYKFAGIEEITRESIDRDTLISVMSASEIDPKNITKDMAWSRGESKASSPVVVYGTITRISAEAVFKRDEAGKAEIEKYLPVYIQTEDEHAPMKPCFSFGLKTKSGKFIRCHVEHQRYATPTLMVEELEEMCKRAIEKHPNDPKGQAEYLNEWFGAVPVLVSGVISSYRETFEGSKATTNIEIGVAAVVETKDRAAGDVNQTMVPEQPATKPQPAPKKEEPKPAPKKEPEKPVQPTVEEPAKPLAPPGLQFIKSIADDIKLWCTAANVDPSSLTLDTLRSKALDRYKEVPDAIIVAAIEKIKKGEL